MGTIQLGRHRRSFSKRVINSFPSFPPASCHPKRCTQKGKENPGTCSPVVPSIRPSPPFIPPASSPFRNNQSARRPRVLSVKASYCQSYILIDSTRTTLLPPLSSPPSPYMVPAGAPWWGGEGGKKLKNILSFFRIFEKKTQKRRQRRGTQEGMEGGDRRVFPKANAMRVETVPAGKSIPFAFCPLISFLLFHEIDTIPGQRNGSRLFCGSCGWKGVCRR